MKELEIPLLGGHRLVDLFEREAAYWQRKLQLLQGPGILPRAIAAKIYGPRVPWNDVPLGDPRPERMGDYLPLSADGWTRKDFQFLTSLGLEDVPADSTPVNVTAIAALAVLGSKRWAFDRLTAWGLDEGIDKPPRVDSRTRQPRFRRLVSEVERILRDDRGTEHAAITNAAERQGWAVGTARKAWVRAVHLAKVEAKLHYMLSGQRLQRYKTQIVVDPIPS